MAGMPRAKAQDPIEVTHVRHDMPDLVFVISATRMGRYSVTLNGKTLFARAEQPVRFPSNATQQEAVSAAKVRINSALPDLFR
jgi:hypothetical protein